MRGLLGREESDTLQNGCGFHNLKPMLECVMRRTAESSIAGLCGRSGDSWVRNPDSLMNFATSSDLAEFNREFDFSVTCFDEGVNNKH